MKPENPLDNMGVVHDCPECGGTNVRILDHPDHTYQCQEDGCGLLWSEDADP